MPGPGARNKNKNKKKKNNKNKNSAPTPVPVLDTSPPTPASTKDAKPTGIAAAILDPGTGPRVRDLFSFLSSPFAARPSLEDAVCDWFFDSTTFGIIEQLLPDELALILHYNKSRLTARICPACRRFYAVGDQLPLLSPEPGSIDELDRQQEDPRTVNEQYISGICSFICFSLALFNYPGARGAWGRTAEHLDAWTTELLNGPGAGIPDQGMSDLVKMTRNHDLGVGYMIARPWPGAPVLYEFDEDVVEGRDSEELWVEEERSEGSYSYSSDSEDEPRGRERTVKPLGASYRR
ncbi:hypothetical protein RhiJN_20541 [Ceratobasidium sp. AG-Ba]|nr:hypothetical protein RhiJN_20541 [Ceratobasidium sp. AG-Ba]